MTKKNNPEKKERVKTVDIVLIVLVVLLVFMAILLIVLKIINRNNLDIRSSKVQELHNYFSTDDLNNCEGLFAYADKKVTYDDLSGDALKCLAYNKALVEDPEIITYKQKKKTETCVEDDMVFRIEDGTNTCKVAKITRKAINDSYIKLFNKDIPDNRSFKPDNAHICYLKGDFYYCGLSETIVYTFGNNSTVYRAIKKAVEKSSDEIVIYDYFSWVNNGVCYDSYTTTSENSECSVAYKNNQKIDYAFMKDNSKLYRHTFKKTSDSETYYWVSSEPV